jgi:hypothetical protein
MSVTVVTGYVPLPCSHRSREEYESLGSRLMALCDNAVAFRCRLEDCWLYQDGMEMGGKDSGAYHVVNHQKSKWLVDVSAVTTLQTLLWIDFGAMHNKELTETVVKDFLAAVEKSPPSKITTPSAMTGSWDRPDPCWMFLGTVLAMPACEAQWFHEQCIAERAAPTTWEVNTWAAVREKHPDKFSLYQANHDHTLMTGYRS